MADAHLEWMREYGIDPDGLDEGPAECMTCRGKGSVLYGNPSMVGQEAQRVPCFDCKGSGYVNSGVEQASDVAMNQADEQHQWHDDADSNPGCMLCNPETWMDNRPEDYPEVKIGSFDDHMGEVVTYIPEGDANGRREEEEDRAQEDSSGPRSYSRVGRSAHQEQPQGHGTHDARGQAGQDGRSGRGHREASEDSGRPQEHGRKEAQDEEPQVLREAFSRQESEGDEEAEVALPEFDDAVEVNRHALEASGQSNHALSRPDNLKGALGRAGNHIAYTGDKLQAAAAIAHGVGQAQAFEDGNKRTAYHLTRAFLAENGLGHVSPVDFDDEELADHLIGYGEKTHTMEDTVEMFRRRAGEKSSTKTAGFDECGFCQGDGRQWENKDGEWVRGKKCDECKGSGIADEPCVHCGQPQKSHDPNAPEVNLTQNSNGSYHCSGCNSTVILFDDDTHACENHAFEASELGKVGAKTRLVMPANCPMCQSSETRGRYHRGGWREYSCLDCGTEFKNRDSKVAAVEVCRHCEGKGIVDWTKHGNPDHPFKNEGGPGSYRCAWCHGAGIDPKVAGSKPCPNCDQGDGMGSSGLVGGQICDMCGGRAEVREDPNNWESCYACDGSGKNDWPGLTGNEGPCFRCKGSGFLPPKGKKRKVGQAHMCQFCQGNGVERGGPEPCKRCKGTGIGMTPCTNCTNWATHNVWYNLPGDDGQYVSAQCDDCAKTWKQRYKEDRPRNVEFDKIGANVPTKSVEYDECPKCEGQGEWQSAFAGKIPCEDCNRSGVRVKSKEWEDGTKYEKRDSESESWTSGPGAGLGWSYQDYPVASKKGSLDVCRICKGQGTFQDKSCIGCRGSGLAQPWEEQVDKHNSEHRNWDFRADCTPCLFNLADHEDGHPQVRQEAEEMGADPKHVDKALKTDFCYHCTQDYMDRKDKAPLWKRPFVSAVPVQFGECSYCPTDENGNDYPGQENDCSECRGSGLGNVCKYCGKAVHQPFGKDRAWSHFHPGDFEKCLQQQKTATAGDCAWCKGTGLMTWCADCGKLAAMTGGKERIHDGPPCKEDYKLKYEQCNLCDGTGEQKWAKVAYKEGEGQWSRCPNCGGMGYDRATGKKGCHVCGDTGQIFEKGLPGLHDENEHALEGEGGYDPKCSGCDKLNSDHALGHPGVKEVVKKDPEVRNNSFSSKYKALGIGALVVGVGAIFGCAKCLAAGPSRNTQPGPTIRRKRRGHVGDDAAAHHSNADKLREEHPYWDECPDCGGDGITAGPITDMETGEQKQGPCKSCEGLGESYDFDYWDSEDQLHDFSNYPAFKEMSIPDKSLKGHLKDEHEQEDYEDAYVHHQTIHGVNVDPEIAEVLIKGKQAQKLPDAPEYDFNWEYAKPPSRPDRPKSPTLDALRDQGRSRNEPRAPSPNAPPKTRRERFWDKVNGPGWESRPPRANPDCPKCGWYDQCGALAPHDPCVQTHLMKHMVNSKKEYTEEEANLLSQEEFDAIIEREQREADEYAKQKKGGKALRSEGVSYKDCFYCAGSGCDNCRNTGLSHQCSKCGGRAYKWSDQAGEGWSHMSANDDQSCDNLMTWKQSKDQVDAWAVGQGKTAHEDDDAGLHQHQEGYRECRGCGGTGIKPTKFADPRMAESCGSCGGSGVEKNWGAMHGEGCAVCMLNPEDHAELDEGGWPAATGVGLPHPYTPKRYAHEDVLDHFHDPENDEPEYFITEEEREKHKNVPCLECGGSGVNMMGGKCDSCMGYGIKLGKTAAYVACRECDGLGVETQEVCDPKEGEDWEDCTTHDHVEQTGTCTWCRGAGMMPGAEVGCMDCNQTGFTGYGDACNTCKGTGWKPLKTAASDYDSCARCDGEGCKLCRFTGILGDIDEDNWCLRCNLPLDKWDRPCRGLDVPHTPGRTASAGDTTYPFAETQTPNFRPQPRGRDPHLDLGDNGLPLRNEGLLWNDELQKWMKGETVVGPTKVNYPENPMAYQAATKYDECHFCYGSGVCADGACENERHPGQSHTCQYCRGSGVGEGCSKCGNQMLSYDNDSYYCDSCDNMEKLAAAAMTRCEGCGAVGSTGPFQDKCQDCGGKLVTIKNPRKNSAYRSPRKDNYAYMTDDGSHKAVLNGFGDGGCNCGWIPPTNKPMNGQWNPCSSCQGTGASSGRADTAGRCTSCRGSGIAKVIQQQYSASEKLDLAAEHIRDAVPKTDSRKQMEDHFAEQHYHQVSGGWDTDNNAPRPGTPEKGRDFAEYFISEGILNNVHNSFHERDKCKTCKGSGDCTDDLRLKKGIYENFGMPKEEQEERLKNHQLCNGTKVCGDCKGEGYTGIAAGHEHEGIKTTKRGDRKYMECYPCKGEGKIDNPTLGEVTCQRCKGSGVNLNVDFSKPKTSSYEACPLCNDDHVPDHAHPEGWDEGTSANNISDHIYVNHEQDVGHLLPYWLMDDHHAYLHGNANCPHCKGTGLRVSKTSHQECPACANGNHYDCAKDNNCGCFCHNPPMMRTDHDKWHEVNSSVSRNCINGNHSDCFNKSCKCDHHADYHQWSESCVDGDCDACRMDDCPHGCHDGSIKGQFRCGACNGSGLNYRREICDQCGGQGFRGKSAGWKDKALDAANFLFTDRLENWTYDKTVETLKMGPCTTCHGNDKDCSACGGKGLEPYQNCSRCKGTGAKEKDNNGVCKVCDGAGISRISAFRSRNCINGNHSDCTASSCRCSHHDIRNQFSGACAEGDHGVCSMEGCPCPCGHDQSGGMCIRCKGSGISPEWDFSTLGDICDLCRGSGINKPSIKRGSDSYDSCPWCYDAPEDPGHEHPRKADSSTDLKDHIVNDHGVTPESRSMDIWAAVDVHDSLHGDPTKCPGCHGSKMMPKFAQTWTQSVDPPPNGGGTRKPYDPYPNEGDTGTVPAVPPKGEDVKDMKKWRQGPVRKKGPEQSVDAPQDVMKMEQVTGAKGDWEQCLTCLGEGTIGHGPCEACLGSGILSDPPGNRRDCCGTWENEPHTDACIGNIKQATEQSLTPCGFCDGSGQDSGCGNCQGLGSVEDGTGDIVTCPKCDGEGAGSDSWSCQDCKGSGLMMAWKPNKTAGFEWIDEFKKQALFDYDPVRDVNPSGKSAPAPSAQGSGGDPWPDQGDNGTAPPRPGFIFDPKLNKWVRDLQGTYPEIGPTFPGVTDINKVGAYESCRFCKGSGVTPDCWNCSGTGKYTLPNERVTDCLKCKGSGKNESPGGACVPCGGAGMYDPDVLLKNGGRPTSDHSGTYACIDCEGTGKCNYPGHGDGTCYDCGDSGICAMCQGAGLWNRPAFPPDPGYKEAGTEMFECPECQGDGKCPEKEYSPNKKCIHELIDGACPGTCSNCTGSGVTYWDPRKLGAYRFHVKPKPGVEVPTDAYESCESCGGTGKDRFNQLPLEMRDDPDLPTCGQCNGAGLKIDEESFPGQLHRDKKTPVDPHGIWDRQEKAWVDTYGKPSDEYWATTKDTAQMRSRELNDRVRNNVKVGQAQEMAACFGCGATGNVGHEICQECKGSGITDIDGLRNHMWEEHGEVDAGWLEETDSEDQDRLKAGHQDAHHGRICEDCEVPHSAHDDYWDGEPDHSFNKQGKVAYNYNVKGYFQCGLCKGTGENFGGEPGSCLVCGGSGLEGADAEYRCKKCGTQWAKEDMYGGDPDHEGNECAGCGATMAGNTEKVGKVAGMGLCNGCDGTGVQSERHMRPGAPCRYCGGAGMGIMEGDYRCIECGQQSYLRRESDDHDCPNCKSDLDEVGEKLDDLPRDIVMSDHNEGKHDSWPHDLCPYCDDNKYGAKEPSGQDLHDMDDEEADEHWKEKNKDAPKKQSIYPCQACEGTGAGEPRPWIEGDEGLCTVCDGSGLFNVLNKKRLDRASPYIRQHLKNKYAGPAYRWVRWTEQKDDGKYLVTAGACPRHAREKKDELPDFDTIRTHGAMKCHFCGDSDPVNSVKVGKLANFDTPVAYVGNGDIECTDCAEKHGHDDEDSDENSVVFPDNDFDSPQSCGSCHKTICMSCGENDLDYTKEEKCDECEGTGKIPEVPEEKPGYNSCPSCKGDGKDQDGSPCFYCRGAGVSLTRGQEHEPEKQCDECFGEGKHKNIYECWNCHNRTSYDEDSGEMKYISQVHPQPVGMHEGDNGIDDPMKASERSKVKKVIPGTQKTVPENNNWNVSIDNQNKTGGIDVSKYAATKAPHLDEMSDLAQHVVNSHDFPPELVGDPEMYNDAELEELHMTDHINGRNDHNPEVTKVAKKNA